MKKILESDLHFFIFTIVTMAALLFILEWCGLYSDAWKWKGALGGY